MRLRLRKFPIFLLLAGFVAPSIWATNSNDLDRLVQQREYLALEARLPAAHLAKVEHDYFEGVLANRQNQLEKSVTLLRRGIPALRRNQPARAAVALHALADDYVKLFRYSEADRAYSEIVPQYLKYFSRPEQQDTRDDAATIHLLVGAPAQTVELAGPFTIFTHHSPLGSTDTDLTVNGVKKSWILDTGANFSVLSETTANQMGLKLSEGTAQTQGVTGAENPLHITIIREIKIGNALVRNVVALVVPDLSVRIPLQKGSYQIDAVLGYPVLSALGALTFSSDGELRVSPGGNATGAVMFMEYMTPLLDCRISGHDLLFSFDTGASLTDFSMKYYRLFQAELAGAQKKTQEIRGAGGMLTAITVVQPELKIGIGNATAVLKNAAIITQPLNTDMDYVYGNMGSDVTNQFRRFTFDFKSMRFRVEADPAPGARSSSS